MQYYVYILTNWDNRLSYIGVTSNLERRLYEHKNELADGYTKKYHIHKLVYFEYTTDIHAAWNGRNSLRAGQERRKML